MQVSVQVGIPVCMHACRGHSRTSRVFLSLSALSSVASVSEDYKTVMNGKSRGFFEGGRQIVSLEVIEGITNC